MRFVLAILMLAVSAHAATYYVRSDGSNANAGTANTSGGAWLTIDYALDQAQPGDTIEVAAGTYAERPTTARAGTSEARITVNCNGSVNFQGCVINHAYITWRGGVASLGIDVAADYVRIEDTEITGDFTSDDYGIEITASSDYGVIDGVHIHDTLPLGSFRANAIQMSGGSNIDGTDGPQAWVIQNCLFERLGYQGISIEGIGTVAQNNRFWRPSGDCFRVFGQDHVVRRNLIQGTIVPVTTHCDFFQTWGTGGGAFEPSEWCKNVLVEENMVVNPFVSATVGVTYNNSGTYDTITRASGSWIADGFDVCSFLQIRGGGFNVRGQGWTIHSVTDSTISIVSSEALTNGTTTATFYGLSSMQVCQMDEGNDNMDIAFNRNVFVNVMGAANNQGIAGTWTNNTFYNCGWNVAHIGSGIARPARSILYIGDIPSAGEAITIGAVTYTWRAIASVAGDLQIGGTVGECRTAVYDAIYGLDGRNSVHPTVNLNTNAWRADGSPTTTGSEQIRAKTNGDAGNGLTTTETMAGAGNYFASATTLYGNDASNIIKNNIYFGCGRSDADNDPSRGWYSIQNIANGVAVTANYNFVANFNGTSKTAGLPGNTDMFKYYEVNGINGGDPLFVDASDPLGPDGLIFTADDGLQLQAGSPLLGAGEEGADIGAYGEGAPAVTGNISAGTVNADAVTIQ